jgi:hypothetical protein
MSFNLISMTKPKAKKIHRCIWCSEKIQIGEVHIKQISSYGSDFQSMRWHPECLDAFEKDYAETHEDEIYPHACKRGTNQPY